MAEKIVRLDERFDLAWPCRRPMLTTGNYANLTQSRRTAMHFATGGEFEQEESRNPGIRRKSSSFCLPNESPHFKCGRASPLAIRPRLNGFFRQLN